MSRPANLRTKERRGQRGAPPADPPPRASRSEIYGLLLSLLIGLSVRVSFPARMAVEHFDEGVYASNLYFTAGEGNEYPRRHLYAPPLLPWLLEWSIALFGPGTVGCFGLNILVGVATIAAAWWVGRLWFGALAAAAAAALVAVLPMFVELSRSCLTDPLLGLGWVLGFGALSIAVRRRRAGWSFSAGLCVAVGWWSKYNGWLPLAICLTGILGWATIERPGGPEVRRILRHWSIMTATAALAWLPVWSGLQPHGGYSAVAANHGRYFHGLASWWPALVRQMENVAAFDWPMPVWLATGTAMLTAGVLSLPDPWRTSAGSSLRAAGSGEANGQERRTGWRTIAMLAPLSLGAAATPWIGIAVAPSAIQILAIAFRGKGRGRSPEEALFDWLALSWNVSLLALTPLYQPYPRLMLPWLLGASIVLGRLPSAACAGALRRGDEEAAGFDASETAGAARRSLWAIPAAVAVLWMLSACARPHGGPDDRQPLAGAVAGLMPLMDESGRSADGRSVAYVFAEPAAFFHLSAANRLAGPVNDLAFAETTARRLPMPTFLIVGPHARDSAAFQEEWRQYGGRFRKVGERSYEPSRFVRLDREFPAEMRAVGRRVERLELFLLD